MQEMPFEPGLKFAHRLDAEDGLAPYRQAFVVAEPDLIYLDGNSLGRLPRRVVDRVRVAVGHLRSSRRLLVRFAHFSIPWYNLF
jgi:kynureninase